jgi:hypothetical protein
MSRRVLFTVVALAAVVAVAVVGALWFSRSGASGAEGAAADSGSAAGHSSASAGAKGSHPALPTAVAEPTAGQVVATDPPPQTAGGSVDVVVTFAAWDAPAGVAAVDGKSGSVKVNGYVSGVVENGGTCTLTLTSGSVHVTGQVTAQADATTTICPEISVSDPRLTPGAWQAVLAYRSPSSQGSSPATKVQVTAR